MMGTCCKDIRHPNESELRFRKLGLVEAGGSLTQVKGRQCPRYSRQPATRTGMSAPATRLVTAPESLHAEVSCQMLITSLTEEERQETEEGPPSERITQGRE